MPALLGPDGKPIPLPAGSGNVKTIGEKTFVPWMIPLGDNVAKLLAAMMARTGEKAKEYAKEGNPHPFMDIRLVVVDTEERDGLEIPVKAILPIRLAPGVIPVGPNMVADKVFVLGDAEDEKESKDTGAATGPDNPKRPAGTPHDSGAAGKPHRI